MWCAARVENHRYNNALLRVLKTHCWFRMIKMVIEIQRETMIYLPDWEIERKEVVSLKQTGRLDSGASFLEMRSDDWVPGKRVPEHEQNGHRDDEDCCSCNAILERSKWHYNLQKGAKDRFCNYKLNRYQIIRGDPEENPKYKYEKLYQGSQTITTGEMWLTKQSWTPARNQAKFPMISFCLNYSTKTASVKVTNDLHVAKSNGQFLLLMLFELSVPSKKVILLLAPWNFHFWDNMLSCFSSFFLGHYFLVSSAHHTESKLTRAQSVDLCCLHLHPHQSPGFRFQAVHMLMTLSSPAPVQTSP